MSKGNDKLTYLEKKHRECGIFGFETFKGQGGFVNTLFHMGPRAGTTVIPVLAIALAVMNYRTHKEKKRIVSDIYDCRADMFWIDEETTEVEQVLKIRDEELNANPHGWVTQSVMLAKFRFPTKRSAKKEVRNLGFSDEDLDSQPNWWRFMQLEPTGFTEWGNLEIGGEGSGIYLVRGLR